MSNIVVNYTQSQYNAKIAELEGYYNQLSTHLARMEDLKSRISDFWDDANGQETATILVSEIRHVQSTMDRTSEMLAFYKSTVEGLGGVNVGVSGLLNEALGLLSKLD